MIIVFSVAMALAVGLILLITPLAQRIGLVDSPGGRKQHNDATPLVGGIAIFCTFMLLVLTLDVPLGQWRSLFLAGALVFIVGLLDDFRETPPSARFIAQTGAALLIVLWGNIRLDDLGFLIGSGHAVEPGWLAVPFSIFCVVGIINATNMMDGIDGLSGGVLLIFFSTLLLVAWRAGLFQEALILAVICGALSGFLVLNFRFLEYRPATVFLGDAGAMFLGLAVAWFLIRFSQEPVAQLRPITAVWFFGLPIMDTVAIMVRRMRRGRSPFAPDREHLHHILLLAGFGVRSTVLIMLGFSLMLTIVGFTGEWLNVPGSYMFYGFLLLFGLYYRGMNRAWKLMKALRKVHERARPKEKLEDSASV
jgi:UDP-GlcNAc:undecaprenyl-phosphate GlcNAc-1-phosphate transferase